MQLGCDVESLLSRAQIAMNRAEQSQAAKNAQRPPAADGASQSGCGQQQQSETSRREAPSAQTQADARRCAAGAEESARFGREQAVQSEAASRARRGLSTQPQAEIDPTAMRDGPATRNLRRGAKGDDVRELQRQLNARGARLAEDGKFGPRTDAALRRFQQQNQLRRDGIAGPRTREALGRDATSDVDRSDRTDRADRTDRTRRTDPNENPANRTATFDKIEKRGRRDQMVTGKITVNGNTYTFKSGGYGRGNLPAGDYTISNLRGTRQAGMVKDGVGFKADMTDKYDARVGGTRTALRIHPDGGSAGTMGCMGIVGDRATLERFRQDLAAELRRNGGRFTLRVSS